MGHAEQFYQGKWDVYNKTKDVKIWLKNEEENLINTENIIADQLIEKGYYEGKRENYCSGIYRYSVAITSPDYFYKVNGRILIFHAENNTEYTYEDYPYYDLYEGIIDWSLYNLY